MQQDQEPGQQPGDASQESFLGSFSRVPNGLDPTQVYSYFLKTQARLRQMEEQAKQTSAPFILEAALREAAEARTQAAHAAERTYNDIVRAAQQEAERLRTEARQDAERTRAEAQQQAQAAVEEARGSLANVEQEAEHIRAEAREEASRIRQQAVERNEQDEQELERLCVDFANLLQRLLDRRKAASEETARGPAAPPVAATFAPNPAPAEERPAPVPMPVPLTATEPVRSSAPTPMSPPAAEEPRPMFRQEEEHASDEWPGETRAETRSQPTAGEAWPDDWSFATPAAPPTPPTPPTAARSEPTHAEDDPPRREEQQGRGAPDGQGGFRLPSWLDM